MCGCDTSQASRRCLKMDDALMLLEEDICLDRWMCVCGCDTSQSSRRYLKMIDALERF